MLVSHPKRIFRLVANVFYGRTTTKLESVIRKIFKNIKVYFFKAIYGKLENKDNGNRANT